MRVLQHNLEENLCGSVWIVLRSESQSGKRAKLRTVAACNNRDHTPRSLYYSSFALHIYRVLLRAQSVRGEQRIPAQRQRSSCNNIPSFLQWTAPIARSLCEGWTPHDLHILVTAPFYCNRKAWAASAQCIAPWQQATIEITRRDHSIIACSRSRVILEWKKWGPLRGQHKCLSCMVIFHCFEN